MADSTQSARSGTHHAVLAGFLGWTLDAFDFFIVVFLFDTLAHQFGVSKKEIVLTTTATLAMRPIGALLFGLLADRYGRRVPLMANVIYFSLIELLCGFSPNYTVFIILRALFGIGMGGEWGVGASLAMEAAPVRWRGVLSGILQSGYSIGFLLAAVAARFLLPHWGWRPMFWIGALPALLALYIRTKVPESEAWKQHRAANTAQVLRVVAGEWKRFAYLVVLMTFMMFLSHGTQDLYPDFLKEWHTGPLSRFSERSAQVFGHRAGKRSDHCEHRRSGRRDPLRAPVASGGTAEGHDCSVGTVAPADSTMGIWRRARGDPRRRFSDAGGSARSLGRDPGALE